MGLFDRFKSSLQKTQAKLVHEVRRIITRSPRLSGSSIEELEAALLGADLGLAVTGQIVNAVRKGFETQGAQGADVFGIAVREVQTILSEGDVALRKAEGGVTVVSVVGVNGTGKTTSCAKLARLIQTRDQSVMLAACDTFRAAAIDQLKIWGERLNIPVVSGGYGSDPAAVGHDAISAAQSRQADYLFIDTAGRLHTKQNLMQELQKLHRVMGKKLPGAPHETLLVLDATTGMNALTQAREFHKAVPLTGLIVTKLDGTSKGGMVVAIQRELKIPIKFVGLGEKADDLAPFNPKDFAEALFSE